MNKRFEILIRRFFCFGLILGMLLFNTAAAYAAEDDPEEQSREESQISEMSTPEESPGRGES